MRACFLASVNPDYASCAGKSIVQRLNLATGLVALAAQSSPFSETRILSHKGCTYSFGFRRDFAASHFSVEKTPRPLLAVLAQSRTPHMAAAAASSVRPISGGLLVKSGSSSSSMRALAMAKPALVSYTRVSCNLRYRMASGLVVNDLALNACLSNPILGSSLRSAVMFSSRCYANGAAPEVPLTDEQLGVSSDVPSEKSSDQATLTLKLVSGSCYLPHPDKVKTGGEDAHFICEDEKVIGVADGVGGWAEVGIDAGEYARQLMSNSVSSIKNDSEASIDPLKVLEKAYASTKAQGSSTACIISLNDKGIHAINLGDSGFIVIRDGSTVFRSPSQQYGFNFPFQLGNDPGADVPSSGQVFELPVKAGDVIVAGTDGLLDNLFDNEISAIVVQATRANLDPKVTAQQIAAHAQKRALDQTKQTPFSTAAQESGYRYYGGKLDDITVVVSYVTDSSCNSGE